MKFELALSKLRFAVLVRNRFSDKLHVHVEHPPPLYRISLQIAAVAMNRINIRRAVDNMKRHAKKMYSRLNARTEKSKIL